MAGFQVTTEDKKALSPPCVTGSSSIDYLRVAAAERPSLDFHLRTTRPVMKTARSMRYLQDMAADFNIENDATKIRSWI
jgi:hypothetical protein